MTIDRHTTESLPALLDDPLVAHLLDAAVDAMVVLGADLEILWVSPATVELLGWTREELCSLGPLALVHPEELPSATEMLGLLLAGEADDAPHVILRLRRRHLEPLWVEVKGTGVHGRSLMVEVTESAFLDDPAIDTAGLQRLRALEVALAIDDFGTGYSSLGYMSRLPVDVVKLDRTLLCGVGSDPQGATLVAAVLELVRALGCRCVAEGIESEAQYRELSRLGCDAGQGYYLARPTTAEAIEASLRGLAADGPWRRAAPEAAAPS